METSNAERVDEAFQEEVLQRTEDDTFTMPHSVPDEVHQLNVANIDLPFEVVRRCVACSAEKTHVYFGRLSIEDWIRIFVADAGQAFVCSKCRKHEGDEGLHPTDRS